MMEPAAGIAGVEIVPLRRIPDERGTIYHMLRSTDPHFIAFGEIYFTSIYRGVVKGWHRHRDMTLNYACISGRIKLVLYDDRPDSPTNGSAGGAVPRPGRLLARLDPTGCLERLQGDGRGIARRQLRDASS